MQPSEMSNDEIIKELMKCVPEHQWFYLSEIRDRLGQHYEAGYAAGMRDALGEEE